LFTQIVLHGALLAVKGGSAIGLSATDAWILLACFLPVMMKHTLLWEWPRAISPPTFDIAVQ